MDTPPYDMKRILEIRTVDKDIEAESWDWIPVCLTSPPSSRLSLERGRGVKPVHALLYKPYGALKHCPALTAG